MGKVLVTGANGHLGNNIVRMLLAEGREVRVMVRRTSNLTPLEGLDVERVYGDLLDAEAMDRAVRGCAAVYHAAAAFLFWARDAEREIVRPTVEGSRAIIRAIERHGVERAVYVSTAGTIGFGRGPTQCRDESHHATEWRTAYLRAKLAAERAAVEAQKRSGLPVVFVLPGLILGPGFYGVSSSVKLVLDFINFPTPVYFDGGFSVVDVEDVARGCLAAEKKGRAGERYILAGENVTVRAFYETIAELTGLPAPRGRAPKLVFRIAAALMEAGGRLFGATPMVTTEQVAEFHGTYGYFSSEKARRELGYRFLPCKEVLRRTIEWLLARGFVKESRRKAIVLEAPPARSA